MVIRRNLLALFFLLSMIASTANATIATNDNKLKKEKRDTLTEEQKARIEAIKNRVTQIKAMDRSKLSKADRKELRQELKGINKEAKDIGGKTFVLVLGGIIIAILLLILLL